MGEFDKKTAEYIKRPEVFADLFNVFMYDGRFVIKPEDLRELDSRAFAAPFGGDGVMLQENRFRDVLKKTVIMEDG